MTNYRSSSRRAFLKSVSATGAVLPLAQLALFVFSPKAAAAQNTVTQPQLAADPLRPQFHLLPARNWMNDPNGPIFWNGNYHMFFQYNPKAAVWGDMHWAHAVSPDMVYWKHLPIALAPTPGGPDQDGCFSGSAVVQDGVATLLYTGVQSVAPAEATLRDGTHNFLETQCLATSSGPQLLTWKKSPAPVLLPPRNPKLTGFRDPFLWRNADTWYMGVGSGEHGEGGRVLLYSSANLRRWDYLHPLASGKRNGKETTDPVDSAEMWECPDFFALGNKHVLFYSTERKVYWESGELDPKDLVFHPRKRGMLDYGDFYAPKSQLAPDNRRILWGWIPETRPEKEFGEAGWAGCMSLPRVLTLDADGNLNMQFAKELEPLRIPLIQLGATGGLIPVNKESDLSEPAAEFLIRFSSKPWGLSIRCGDAQLFSVTFDEQNKDRELQIAGHMTPLPPRSSGDHKLRLFLDASVIESIADNSMAFTTRIYRPANTRLHIALVDPFGSATNQAELTVWAIKPISSDRLTT